MFFISKLCFACLKTYKNLKRVLIDNSEEILIQKKLKYCLPEMAVDFHSEIPKYICRNCVSTLECVYKFKQTCLRNNVHLKNYLQSLTSADKSFKYLSVSLTDVKYQNTLEDNRLEEPHSEETDIVVKEELIDDKVDVEYYRDFVKSIKCESISSDSDVSISRDEDIIQENSCSEINWTNSEKNKVTVNKHIRKKKRYECAICSRVYFYKGALEYHLKIHADINDFKCSICQKGFKNKSHLTQHEKIHTGVRNFECLKCKNKFTCKGNLIRHEKIHIDINKSYECSKCKKRFRQNYELVQHEKAHTAVKNFECGICKKRFLFKSILKKHEKIHTDIKNYECATCNKKFMQKYYLIQHEKIHVGVKNYECGICSKKFMHKGGLIEHENIHADVKKFECLKCKNKFIFKSNLRRHVKICTAPELDNACD